MRTIAFINWKGGVGKTTCSTNTAYLFGEVYGLRVLFIDLDKQGNASSWFGVDPKESEVTVSNIFRQWVDADPVKTIKPMSAKDAILKTRYEHIDLIAANATLKVMDMALLTHYKDRQDNILYNSLKDIAGNYDICIIDTPPDSNIPVLNGLFLTDDIIAITLPNTYGLDGIKHLETELTNYNQNLDISAKIKGVVINQFTSTPDTYRIMDELREQYKILPTIKAGRMAIKRLNECINQQKSIYELSPNSGFAKDLKKVVKSIVEG